MENIRVKLKLLKQPRPDKPRFMIKEQALKQIDVRRTEVDRRVVSIGESTIFSGECEYSFQMKIVGVTNMLKLFRNHPRLTPQNQSQLSPPLFTSHS